MPPYPSPFCAPRSVPQDAGAEYHHYTSDVTRTWPVNGKFSAAQKRVYEAVLDCNQQIIAAHAGGPHSGMAIQSLSAKLLTERLVDFGVLKGTVQSNLAGRAYAKYYPHAIGHPMGWDIHEEDTNSLGVCVCVCVCVFACVARALARVCACMCVCVCVCAGVARARRELRPGSSFRFACFRHAMHTRTQPHGHTHERMRTHTKWGHPIPPIGLCVRARVCVCAWGA